MLSSIESFFPFLSIASYLPSPNTPSPTLVPHTLAQPPNGSLKEKRKELLLFNYKCYCSIYEEEHFKLN